MPGAARPGGDGTGHPRPLCGSGPCAPHGGAVQAERDRGM